MATGLAEERRGAPDGGVVDVDGDLARGAEARLLAAQKGPGALAAAREAVERLGRAGAALRRAEGPRSPRAAEAGFLLALALWDLGWLEHDGRKQVRAIKVLDELLVDGDRALAVWKEASALRDELAAKGIQGFSIPKRPARRSG